MENINNLLEKFSELEYSNLDKLKSKIEKLSGINMSDSKIEWCDKTWNPITGCTKVSPGCKHCYAELEHKNRHQAYKNGKQMAPQYAEPFEIVQFHRNRMIYPLRWKNPQKIFVCSGSDLFHEDVSGEHILGVYAVAAYANRHTYIVLTKRLHNTKLFYDKFGPSGDKFKFGDFDNSIKSVPWPLENLWLGASVEDQKTADERIDILLNTPVAVRFVSLEPLLDQINIRPYIKIDWEEFWLNHDDDGWSHCDAFCEDGLISEADYECDWINNSPDKYIACPECARRDIEMRIYARKEQNLLNWVIVGGESGPNARRLELDWIRDVINQCREANVPVFVKQLGSVWAKENSAKHRRGADMSEWPEDLRIREWPKTVQ